MGLLTIVVICPCFSQIMLVTGGWRAHNVATHLTDLLQTDNLFKVMQGIIRGSKEPTLILDSSLIVATFKNKYDLKVVNCGDYAQVYMYEKTKTKKNEAADLELTKKKKKNIIINDNENVTNNELKAIALKNIIRSKLECQRLAKCNIKDWKTFITLTFAENVTDVSKANKRFRNFVTLVQRNKKDFKYICIPEFQERGAVHYHLLTNIDINDNMLIFSQEDNPKFKHIKYWKDGFTNVQQMQGDVKKIIGYIAKYMTKNIDNRLYNRHRYFYSQNLNKPRTSYIDLDNSKHVNFFKKIIQDKDLIYNDEYNNPYTGEKVQFLEYTTHSNCTTQIE